MGRLSFTAISWRLSRYWRKSLMKGVTRPPESLRTRWAPVFTGWTKNGYPSQSRCAPVRIATGLECYRTGKEP